MRSIEEIIIHNNPKNPHAALAALRERNREAVERDLKKVVEYQSRGPDENG